MSFFVEVKSDRQKLRLTVTPKCTKSTPRCDQCDPMILTEIDEGVFLAKARIDGVIIRLPHTLTITADGTDDWIVNKDFR